MNRELELLVLAYDALLESHGMKLKPRLSLLSPSSMTRWSGTQVFLATRFGG